MSYPISNNSSSATLTLKSPKNGPSKKCKWTQEEDRSLIESVKKHGMTNWSLVATEVNGRTGKQCRERWTNQLCPALNKSDWTTQEDQILIKQQQLHGNTWSKIARYLPGRSLNAVKNRWSWLSRHNVTNALSTISATSNKTIPKKYFYNPMAFNISRPLSAQQKPISMTPVVTVQPALSDQLFEPSNLSDLSYSNSSSAMSDETEFSSPMSSSSSINGLNQFSNENLELIDNPLFEVPVTDDCEFLESDLDFPSVSMMGYWDAY